MRFLLFIGLLFIAGCESNPLKPNRSQATTAAASSDADVVCVREREVGSHISKRRCRTREQIQQEEEAARRTIDTIRSQPNVINN